MPPCHPWRWLWWRCQQSSPTVRLRLPLFYYYMDGWCSSTVCTSGPIHKPHSQPPLSAKLLKNDGPTLHFDSHVRHRDCDYYCMISVCCRSPYQAWAGEHTSSSWMSDRMGPKVYYATRIQEWFGGLFNSIELFSLLWGYQTQLFEHGLFIISMDHF